MAVETEGGGAGCIVRRRFARLTGALLYTVHMSAKRPPIRQPSQETCPQYLYLPLKSIYSPVRGRESVCSTPLRFVRRGSSRRVVEGVVHQRSSVVSTDYALPRNAACFGRPPSPAIPEWYRVGRAPHVDLIYRCRWPSRSPAGSNPARLPPARMFGLYPRCDCAGIRRCYRRVRLRPDNRNRPIQRHLNVESTGVEGFEVGRPTPSSLRGTVVVRDREYIGSKGHGRYLKRGQSR